MKRFGIKRPLSPQEDPLEQAVQGGEMDNLPGSGKPLDLEGYLDEDPDTRIAHRMLKSHGFSLPWIEEMKEIDRLLDQSRGRLRQAWKWYGASTNESGGYNTARWEEAKAAFREQVTDLNRQLLTFNLKVPVARFQRSRIDPEREIQQAMDDKR